MPELSRMGHERKYCSTRCKGKAHAQLEQSRLNADPARRHRKRLQGRACWKRTKEQRPEDYRAAYRKKLKNPVFRIAKSFRNRLQDLIRKGRGAKHGRFADMLGCPWEHLKAHIERQFTGKMRWDNYGTYWHVDHIIPLAGFGQSLKDPTQAKIAFNWQNLRPLTKKKNQTKSGKITDPQQPLPLSFA
jgi:5-methylcytosine-specific restriction endonuclease McrA